MTEEGPPPGTPAKDAARWCYFINAPCRARDFRRRLDTPAQDVCEDCPTIAEQEDIKANLARILREENNILGQR